LESGRRRSEKVPKRRSKVVTGSRRKIWCLRGSSAGDRSKAKKKAHDQKRKIPQFSKEKRKRLKVEKLP